MKVSEENLGFQNGLQYVTIFFSHQRRWSDITGNILDESGSYAFGRQYLVAPYFQELFTKCSCSIFLLSCLLIILFPKNEQQTESDMKGGRITHRGTWYIMRNVAIYAVSIINGIFKLYCISSTLSGQSEIVKPI